jgi:hypothetical protein
MIMISKKKEKLPLLSSDLANKICAIPTHKVGSDSCHKAEETIEFTEERWDNDFENVKTAPTNEEKKEKAGTASNGSSLTRILKQQKIAGY